MILKQDIPYGGSYREKWDDTYRLTIDYENRKVLSFIFDDGKWTAQDEGLPDMPLAEQYFTQAADAAVAVREFIASGLTAQDFSLLSPDRQTGPVFAAESMRILMDEYGRRMETVYPYVAKCCNGFLNETELEQLSALQPRTCHVLKLLQNQILRIPSVRHDLRLEQYRAPIGALRTGQEIRLAISAPDNAFSEACLELFGDELRLEYPMSACTDGWEVRLKAPEQAAALWYRFRLKSGEGTQWLCTAPDGIHSWLRNSAHDGFRLTVYDKDFSTPLWFQNAVMYQVFPDRFAFSDDNTAEKGIAYHRSLGQQPELHQSLEEEVRWKPRSFEKSYIPDDFYGGTLKGIMAKLPYLKQLGVTCLYLNPVVEARSNHRYDTSDYLRVDPILGSNEDFIELCGKADEYGIRILCDGVFSHTGADSIYFNRDGHYPKPGACQQESSPYDTWYDFQHFPDEYRSWWGFRELPEVNENDSAWQNYVVTGENSVVRRWLRMGASGWRLDVADELPDEVLALIRKAAKTEKPDSVILGEVWEDAVLKESYGSRRKYALGSSLDSVMNYPFRTAVLDFLHGRTDAFALSDFLTAQQHHYPQPLYRSLMNLLGSHDVERLRTCLATNICLKELSREDQLAAEEKLTDDNFRRAEQLEKLAACIQFSVPGVPSIYYGDEQGMTGVNDPFNRRPMPAVFPEKSGNTLYDYVRSLSQFRREHTALQTGDAFFLANDFDVLLILRSADKESVLTVINRSDEERPYLLDLFGRRAEGIISPCSAHMEVLHKGE